MRALVTGGAGFIGSTLVEELRASGHEVLVVDDLSRGRLANIETALDRGARFAQVDVRDADALIDQFLEFAPEVVFHFAAQVDVRASVSDPTFDAEVNVLGSLNVLEAARRVGARRVVNTSTGGAIYGETDVVPTPETVAPDPLSAYGLSKRAAESYAEWYRRFHGLSVITLRYGNVYGPRQDPRGDAGVVAILCACAADNRRPVVFGGGTQTRDFVYVGDIVAANLAAASVEDPPHAVYNVGTGSEVSVLELLDQVRRVAGIDVEAFAPVHEPARRGELLRSCLDVDLARKELGLDSVTPLREGLTQTLRWVRDLTP